MNPISPNIDPWANWDYAGSSDDDQFPNRFTQQPLNDATTTKPVEKEKEDSGR